MGLLQEITEEAVSKNTDIPRLLRLCLVLAARLGHAPLKEWARLELEGYPIEVAVPPYRVMRVRNLGQFEDGHHAPKMFEIPVSLLPESIRDHYKKSEFRDSVAECAHLVDSLDKKTGRLQIPWPIELAVKYASKLVSHGQCAKAWMEVSPSELVGLLDQIRTKVLAFVLEIEAADPSAGEIGGPAKTKLQTEAVTHIFNTTITGPVQNLALGSSNVWQSAVSSISSGDEPALLKALESMGVSEDDRGALHDALVKDRAGGAKGMGAKVKEWLGGMAKKASETAASEGAKAGIDWATKALLAYFGS